MASRLRSFVAAVLGRHVDLPLGAVRAFVVLDLLLVAVCLFALRQNVDLRAEVKD